MKPKQIISGRWLLAISAITLSIALISWDFKQSPARFYQSSKATDTVPKEKKIRNLDDVLDELNAAEMKVNTEQVQKEIAEAMKKIEKIDVEKIKMEMDKAMKEVDIEKIKKDVQESVAKINWDKMKDELEEVKKMNMDKLQDQMQDVKKQMEKIGPQIQKEMEKAKGQIEKAKAEMKGYKDLTEGLEKDGLINNKEDYTIKHKDGELIVNGKKVSDDIYSKYRSFLENHKTFTIEKNGDNFNINNDKHID